MSLDDDIPVSKRAEERNEVKRIPLLREPMCYGDARRFFKQAQNGIKNS